MRIEKSADEIDMSSELEMAFTEKALEAVVAKLRPEHHPDFNGKDCVECDDPLPDLRIADRRIRCVPCQTAIERRFKTTGRRHEDS